MRKIVLCSLICLLLTGCTVGIVRREALTRAPTGTPAPTQTPPATRTLPPTLTPTASPTMLPTDTPTHTPTPTRAPVIPTDTPPPPATETPAPCLVDVGPAFSPRLDSRSDILQALGCPSAEQQQQWAAEQGFQRGRMFWKQDTREVYILYNSGSIFQVGADPYVEGDPDDACPEVGDAPEGLYKPVRGFNRQWCNVAGVRDELGWALEPEGGYDAVWQRFERGLVLQSRAGHIFVLYDEGLWDYVE